MEEPAFFVFFTFIALFGGGIGTEKEISGWSNQHPLNIRYKKSIFRQLFPSNRFKIKKCEDTEAEN